MSTNPDGIRVISQTEFTVRRHTSPKYPNLVGVAYGLYLGYFDEDNNTPISDFMTREEVVELRDFLNEHFGGF